ncbi:MAG: cytidine deaminase [Acidobacteria bacterium]|nr:cytidine deaminase [Acidobacteriota bacterium]
MNEKKLLTRALQSLERAYAPYSNFRVGAALLADSGVVYTGCNIENASYGLTICAERVAIFKAISEGERRFRMLCVVADTPEPTPPCGACRQIIWELCGDIPVILANPSGNSRTFTMRELLPFPFDGDFLAE